MPWIKKNLTLVLGGLVGLVLLAGSGLFLFSQLHRESDVDAQLLAKKDEWTALNDRNPFPDDKNIKSVREESARIEKLADELRASIHDTEIPPATDTYRLRVLIETTISNLTREADDAGVTLPDSYAFTFQKLREMGGEFNSNGIPRIALQVSQITTLCRVLFNAKIHSLDTLRRSPVLKEESGSDFLTSKGLTNQWVVRTPYDLSFRCFSTELAEVVKGLAALDQCVVIKTLNVEPTSLPRSSRSGMMPGVTMAPPAGGPPLAGPGMMDPALRARYGLGPGGPGGGRNEGGEAPGAGMSPELRSRYGLGPPGAGGGGMSPDMRSRYGMGPGASYAAPQSLMNPANPPTTPMAGAPRGPQVVLEEKPLRIILQLDFVTPAPVGKLHRQETPAAEAGTDVSATEAPPSE